jgi:magnesium chelatase family protein
MPKPPTPATPVNLKELLRRSHTVYGGVLHGLEGHLIELQARATQVLPSRVPWRAATTVSGMARGSVFEALDRISGAFSALDIPEPRVEVLVNLAPPDLPKDGTWLDLPLAILLLQASGYLPDHPDHLEGDLIMAGELGLHGELRRVPGVLSIAMKARPRQSLLLPSGNEREAALILAKPGHEGCRVYALSLLSEVIEYFRDGRGLEDNLVRGKIKFAGAVTKAPDFGLIRGQQAAKDAALIAAAGGHNLLLYGPPGEGKSLLASAIPGILPKLSEEETVQLTRIYSAAGALDRDGMVVHRRPFRTVHHTTSKQALVGGGSGLPRPGEITLSHHGVLFLDELAEFSAGTLDALRQPIESGEVTITRVGGTLTFPCRFALVAAMNPCPCGYYPTDRCRCGPAAVKKYLGKISGPILDRIDLQVEIKPLSVEERFAATEENVTPRLQARVEAARAMQRRRFGVNGPPFNAAIPGGRVLEMVRFSPAGMEQFKGVVGNNQLSTRTMDRLAKVARTVADLATSDAVEPSHVDRATGYLIGGLLRDL